MIIEKKNRKKKFKSIMFSAGLYITAILLGILFIFSTFFVSYQKITSQSSQARVIVVEDEITIEYKEIENENNID